MAGSTADVARWTGAASGVFGTAGNWIAESGTPSTPPANGETALFDDRANADCTSGSSNSLGLLLVRGWRGNLGAPGSSVTITATDVDAIFGGGTIYLICTSSTFDLDGTLGGTVYLTGGTQTLLRAENSNVDIGASCVVTTGRFENCKLNVEDNATGFTTLELRNCSGTVDRAGTTLENDVSTTIIEGANAWTTINNRLNSTLNYKSSGTIGTLNNYGFFTPAGSPFSFTISALAGPKSAKTILTAPGGVTVTVSNDNRWGAEDGGGIGGFGA